METLNRILPINDGKHFRIRCISVSKFSSQWVIEEFVHSKFLWWEWDEWTVIEYKTNYGAGETTHECILKKRHDEEDIHLIWFAESELDFLGVEYE